MAGRARGSLGVKAPWFRASHGKWFATVGGRQINLRTADKAEAWTAFHRLMSLQTVEGRARSAASITVVELFTRFLDWTAQHRAKATMSQHRLYLGQFARSLAPGAVVAELIPYDLTKWLDAQGKGNGFRRGAISSVHRAINWGVDQGLLAANPLRSVKRPRPGRREMYLTAEQQQAVLDACADQAFRDLLAFALETGARPIEVTRLEARHLHGDTVVFPPGEQKTGEKTGKPRVIYLTAKAKEIVERMAAAHPSGPIFRNARGNPWDRNSINRRFRRGRKSGRFPPGLTMYAMRHSYATSALRAGVTPEELRLLLGHQDLSMIAKHYSHLGSDADHIRDAAKRARS